MASPRFISSLPTRILWTLISVILLTTACTPDIIEEWRNIAPVAPGDITTLQLRECGRSELTFFGQKPQKFRYEEDTAGYIFRQRREQVRYGYRHASPDSVVLIRTMPASEKIMVMLPKDKYLEHLASERGHQQSVYSLIGALQASTVEARSTNVISLFGEGDYISTTTILQLIGLPNETVVGERDDFQKQRILAKKIKRVYRSGDKFVFELYNPEPFETRLPLYGKDRSGEGRFELDLAVARHVYIQVTVLKDGLKVDVEGVKVGKGWFKLGVPSLKVKGDYGYLLGIKFYLAR